MTHRAAWLLLWSLIPACALAQGRPSRPSASMLKSSEQGQHKFNSERPLLGVMGL
jgi:hypothetical protein